MIKNTTQFVTKLSTISSEDDLKTLFTQLPECEAKAIGILQTTQLEAAYAHIACRWGHMGLNLDALMANQVQWLRFKKAK